MDFVLKEEKHVAALIQVCRNPGDLQTRNREVRSLEKAMAEFKLPEGIVLTEDHEETQEIPSGVIRFISLWKWLED